jgi:hypothetical protein
MTTATNSLPVFEISLIEGKTTNKVWYFFFKSLLNGNPPAVEFAVTPTGSPFTFVAPQRGFLIVNGGTISLIQFSRSGTTNYTTGQTAGCFPLSAGDSLIIRYSADPQLTFVPQ